MFPWSHRIREEHPCNDNDGIFFVYFIVSLCVSVEGAKQLGHNGGHVSICAYFDVSILLAI